MPMDELRERTRGQWWDSTEEFVVVRLQAVRKVCLSGLESAGASRETAQYLLDNNLDKAIQGDHSRGLGRMPAMVRAARAGRLDVNPTMDIVMERDATALVRGPAAAPALLVGRFAMDLAIAKARGHGVGWVGAQASGGILTPYVRQAIDAGMVGMVMAQSFPSVAPHGGHEPLLGNGPFAVGVPAGRHDPIVMDMSFTETSASGAFQTAQQGQQAPEGFLLDERGGPTTTAADVFDLSQKGRMAFRGSLATLGGSHKSYAMIFVLGLLTSILADASPPWDVGFDSTSPGVFGTVLVAVDPSGFLPRGDLEARVDAYIDRVKASPAKGGVDEILYPGEYSQRVKRERNARGEIAIPASHYHGLAELAKELGMEGAI